MLESLRAYHFIFRKSTKGINPNVAKMPPAEYYRFTEEYIQFYVAKVMTEGNLNFMGMEVIEDKEMEALQLYFKDENGQLKPIEELRG